MYVHAGYNKIASKSGNARALLQHIIKINCKCTWKHHSNNVTKLKARTMRLYVYSYLDTQKYLHYEPLCYLL